MRGRPVGFNSLVKALGRLSASDRRRALALAPRTVEIEKLEGQREEHLTALKKLDRQIAKLSGSNGSVATGRKRGRKPGRKKGYKLSAATRRKMSEAAKRRYAGKGKAKAAAAGKRRRTMSPATRAKMAAAAKARWEKVKGTAEAKP